MVRQTLTILSTWMVVLFLGWVIIFWAHTLIKFIVSPNSTAWLSIMAITMLIVVACVISAKE